MKIGWFTPLSIKSGISKYSATILNELHSNRKRFDIDVTVYFPPTNNKIYQLDFPAIPLTSEVISTLDPSPFDIAIYHVGNNAINHDPILRSALRKPGIIALHDYTYQHYYAGFNHQKDFISHVACDLLISSAGRGALEVLSRSGVLKGNSHGCTLVPWETQWGLHYPGAKLMSDIGLATIVHSKYAHSALYDSEKGNVKELFLPCTPVVNVEHNPKRSDVINIMYCGHIQSTKGLELIVGAFSENPDLKNRFSVTIAGYSSDKPYLKRLKGEIEGVELGDTIRIISDPTGPCFNELMMQADVFYNFRRTNTEGASLSLSEQLSMGKPVIACRSGSFAETPEDCCFFVPNETRATARDLADVLDYISPALEFFETPLKT